jgi:aldehyde dehydrogenase (NAD+)
MLGRLVAEHTDIPPGVVNVVASTDHLLGEMHATDPRVDLVTSPARPRRAGGSWRAPPGTVKKVFLELGGSRRRSCSTTSTCRARSRQIGGVCAHAGQGCAHHDRLLLPRSR